MIHTSGRAPRRDGGSSTAARGRSLRDGGSSWRRRGLAVAALAVAGLSAPGLASAAQASATADPAGTWRYYGTSGVPLTSAWHCGRTGDAGSPYYLSAQACVIKQSGYEQVALIVNARAANNVAVRGVYVHESSNRDVWWNCGSQTMSLGYTVCFGSSAAYSGAVSASGQLGYGYDLAMYLQEVSA